MSYFTRMQTAQRHVAKSEQVVQKDAESWKKWRDEHNKENPDAKMTPDEHRQSRAEAARQVDKYTQRGMSHDGAVNRAASEHGIPADHVHEQYKINYRMSDADYEAHRNEEP
jgi:hypothetical protein